MLAGQERGQHPDLPGHRPRTLPSGQSEWTDRSGGDRRRPLVAAANRSQLRTDLVLLSGGDVDRVNAWFGTCAGRPGIADLAVEAAPAVVVDQQGRLELLAQPDGGVG